MIPRPEPPTGRSTLFMYAGEVVKRSASACPAPQHPRCLLVRADPGPGDDKPGEAQLRPDELRSLSWHLTFGQCLLWDNVGNLLELKHVLVRSFQKAKPDDAQVREITKAKPTVTPVTSAKVGRCTYHTRAG